MLKTVLVNKNSFEQLKKLMILNPQIKIIGNFQYSPQSCIGEGTFGKVFQGKSLITQEPVAIKQIDVWSFQKDSYLKQSLS